MRSGTRAPTLRRAARSAGPCSALLSRRGALASACSAWRKQRGLATAAPVLRGATVLRPPSRPTGCPDSGSGQGSAHAPENDPYPLPVLRRRLGAVWGVLGVPSPGRCQRTCTGPPFLRRRRLASRSNHVAADRHLRAGAAFVAPRAATAWGARLFCALAYAAKARLESPVNAHGALLHHRRRHASQRGSLCLEDRQRGLLVVQAHRRLPLFPASTPLGQPVMVQPTALFTLLVEETLLRFVRLHAVPERLTPALSSCLLHASCQASRALHPLAQAAGLSGPVL
jgi:hypothetical protein